MEMFKEKKNKEFDKGFVILMASLLAGIFLIIGASIFSISLKELILSSGGKSSQNAFYAADSGLECASYWDIDGDIFATSTLSVEPSSGTVYCNGKDITTDWDWGINSLVTAPETNATEGKTIFTFDMFPGTARQDCVEVTVWKDLVGMITESRGYNTCDTSHPRRVERAVRITVTY